MASFNSNWIHLGLTSTSPLSATAATEAGFDNTFDLALGEVYGLRMWKVDIYGRLRARNWSEAGPWKPGINIAKCLAEPRPKSALPRSRSMRNHVVDPTGQGRVAVNVVAEHDPSSLTYMIMWDDGTSEQYSSITFVDSDGQAPHEVPFEGCRCGFYAYTDSKHADTVSYKEQGVVLGVIRGTGRTIIGTRGFRCEKAEILALRDPTRGGRHQERTSLKGLLERNYPDVPLLPSRAALLEFAPLTDTLPDPSSPDFWTMP